MVDNFTVQGNTLGALNWDGRLDEWYTGWGLSGHWEDIECDRFHYDIDAYLATAHSSYRDIDVRCCPPGGKGGLHVRAVYMAGTCHSHCT